MPLANYLTGFDGIVDHINRNPMDFRKDNLRPADRAKNGQNRGKQKGLVTSRFKGVCWVTREQRWRAHIRVYGRGIYLGQFTDEETAARAYDEAAERYFGEYACTNRSMGLVA